jgi:DNA-binding IclR family transcriptional regulator
VIPATEPVLLVARTLDVLELLAASGAPMSFTEICERTGIPKATIHRLLTTLQGRGYVAQESRTGEYTAGIRCFELGSMWAQSLDVRACAAPVLKRLNDDSRVTVLLGVYEYGDVVYIDRIESPQQVIAKSYVGRRCPAPSVATGRVLLAFSDLAEIDRVLGEPLPRFTDRSIVDPGELRELLAATRANGYAVNRCSYRAEVSGIGAPIRDHTGAVVASVGVCLPDHRLGPERFDTLRDLVVEAGKDITSAIGGRVDTVTAGSGLP